jgi:hypothetical protein
VKIMMIYYVEHSSIPLNVNVVIETPSCIMQNTHKIDSRSIFATLFS